jgi:hypothetical protein
LGLGSQVKGQHSKGFRGFICHGNPFSKCSTAAAMPRSCSSRSNQGLSRACLVFLTRLAGLQTSKRCSAVTDVLKAAVALDAAASVITPPVDAFGSPSGLALSQSFQLARDACAAISDLYTFGQKNLSKNLQNQSQQRTCIRAALKAILALLPLHVRPGDEASQELLHKVSMVGVSLRLASWAWGRLDTIRAMCAMRHVR